LNNSLDLLASYRELCEAAGAARAAGTPLSQSTREQLAELEAALRTRLVRLGVGPTSTALGTRRADGQDSRETGGSGAEPHARHRSGAATNGAGTLVYCDGACIKNPGPGGYGVIVRVPGHPEQETSGGKARTTNNEMEMTGAIVGLKLAASLGADEITVVSDSEYLVKGMTGWVRGWLRNGWKTSTGQPVKNRPLWEELHRLCQQRSVTWTWTRGHHGQSENERCDALAMAAAQRAASRG